MIKRLTEGYYKLQIFARQNISNKIYFLGPQHVGKTTLVEELRKRQPELHLPNKLKSTAARSFTFREAQSKIEYSVFDAGGDDEHRWRWFDALSNYPPIGLVFVIDHRQNRDVKKSLKQIWGKLDNVKHEQPTAITRGILVFINKYDLWENQTTPQEIIAPIENEISKFDLIGIAPIIRWGSAQYYEKYWKLLDTSFSDFHRLLFDPLAKTSKWPEKL